MLKILAWFALILLPVTAIADQCAVDNSSFHKAVLAVHNKQRNVGLGVVVLKAGQEIYSDYIGLADVENSVPVTVDTQFGIASITKLYTAALLLMYEAEGKIDLDATVQKYIPDFPIKPEGEITVRMLATHTSGIPHPQAVRTPKLFATHYATAMEALEVFRDDALLSTPGTTASYSSSNYNLLAAIIEQTGGQRFTDIMEQAVFDPLGLDASSFDNVSRVLPQRARRYSFYRAWDYAESDELYTIPMWDYSFNTGGGNITATASDVARFGAALVSPGLLEDEQFETIYNWFGDDAGGRFIYASGANPGLQAGLAVYPEAQVSVSVLSNTWGIGSRSAEMTALAQKLAEMCIARNPNS
jgi:CubicO group peptidase (beta-lactamase class C family)